MEIAGPKRIVVLGNSGGGKSTLARQLGEALDLPVYHLDRLFWRTGWVESAPDEFEAKVLEVAALDRWVIDGNYSRTLPARIDRADLIIWIDVTRVHALWRVAKRAVTQHGRTRPDMGDDCPEHIDFAFFDFVWNYPNRRGIEHRQMAKEAKAAGKRVVVLASGRQVVEFVKHMTSSRAASKSSP
jgi:adenylate kinase family enzyme